MLVFRKERSNILSFTTQTIKQSIFFLCVECRSPLTHLVYDYTIFYQHLALTLIIHKNVLSWACVPSAHVGYKYVQMNGMYEVSRKNRQVLLSCR